MVLGCIVQLVTSFPSVLASAGKPGLAVALVLVGLGTGGVRTTLPPLLAEQTQDTKPRVVAGADGTKQVIDSDLTLQYIYNVFYA